MLAKLIKTKREKAQITSIRSGKWDITTDLTLNLTVNIIPIMKRIIKECHEQFYTSNLNILKEIDKFLERHDYEN